MKRTLAALATLLVITACGSSDDSDSKKKEDADASSKSQESAAPATGTEIKGTGYTYRVPEGWGIPDQKPPAFDPDSFAVQKEDKDGFTDNVNVVASPIGKIEADQAEQAAKQELETVGATNISVNDRTEVAGNETPHVSAEIAQGSVEYATEQFFVGNGEKMFVVTFSFSRDLAKEDRAKVTGPLLASWTWTD